MTISFISKISRIGTSPKWFGSIEQLRRPLTNNLELPSSYVVHIIGEHVLFLVGTIKEGFDSIFIVFKISYR